VYAPATHCNTLRHTATHCDTLQHTATHTVTWLSIAVGCSLALWGGGCTCVCSCNTLRHTATHCDTLQHTATQCNTVQHTATHCNIQGSPGCPLQRGATHCNTLQHTATHCNTPLHTRVTWMSIAAGCSLALSGGGGMCVCSRNTLQHGAARCSTVQHAATHCNLPQHTATHSNTKVTWLSIAAGCSLAFWGGGGIFSLRRACTMWNDLLGSVVIHIHTCIHMYIHIYFSISICTHIHIYIHVDIQIYRPRSHSTKLQGGEDA